MGIKIRCAENSDIDKIMEIEFFGFSPCIRESKNVFLKRIQACSELVLIFEINNEIAGYLSGEFLSNIPLNSSELKLGHTPDTPTEKNYIYISSFSLLPDFRGNGNGSNCWNLAIDYFENNFDYKNLLLLVNEAWPNAKHIYEKSGFYEIDTFVNFFPTEDQKFTNGCLMKK